ncbi:721_t:CDS:1 [Dentiscutata erythropus]|uniref:721_t:CDS:1 n=1 Tax=Dentiscutata erythropus TaxID=1348616 RepID=A0A9N9BTW8_9GLOM|nr:721_t:CDS:1 [Dentiscutata erythropus]
MITSSISSIFSYKNPDDAKELVAKLSGTDKENRKWIAREVQNIDLQYYEKLLSDEVVVKYFGVERPWTNEKIRNRLKIWENRYNEGHPHGAFTIFDDQNKFIGYIVAGQGDEKGVSELAYVLSCEYWNKGIGQSVLSKIVEEWGPEVRRIGLGEGFENLDKQYQVIQKKFQCFDGEILKRFYATARPINISSWRILEKVGFESAKSDVENAEDPIDFNVKGFDLPLLDYCSQLESFIEELYKKQEIKVDKRYFMVNENDKIYTFSRMLDGRTRFHYEKEIN